MWREGAYSIILTKAAFLHHKYFDMYTNAMPASIRTYIDEKRNCEDIAMQYLISNYTGLPPLYVKGHLSDYGALGGISTSKNFVVAGHMTRYSFLNPPFFPLSETSKLFRFSFLFSSPVHLWKSIRLLEWSIKTVRAYAPSEITCNSWFSCKWLDKLSIHMVGIYIFRSLEIWLMTQNTHTFAIERAAT